MVLTTEQMLEKFSKDSTHPDEVRKFAMMIFDGVNETLHDLTDLNRKMLEAASLLHDIGYCVEEKNHNKHSQRLILKYGLDDFSQKQKEIISCIARYHRGSLPDKKEHDIYCALDKKERKTVKRLGGILKIADGLSHIKLIDRIKIVYDEENNITEFFIIPSHIDYRPDISYVIKKKDLFEIGFKTQAVFKFEQ